MKLKLTTQLRLLVSTMLVATSMILVSVLGFTTTNYHNKTPMQKPRKLFALQASSLVVVSPPGGVGEITAVKAAEMGSQVQWFVVKNDSQTDISLSQSVLDKIDAAGGNVEVAGADVQSLLTLEGEDSAVPAISAWCRAADALVCTFDGVDAGAIGKKKNDQENPVESWRSALKVAAKEVASSSRPSKRIAVLDASDEQSEKEPEGGIGALLGTLINPKETIPPTLSAAMGSTNIVKLRHGQLFGVPESSPEFSPLVGGLRRDPELCEELRMRSIRIDPILSVSGNRMMDGRLRSSRHSIGEAAALVSQGKIRESSADTDVFISSQPGRDPVSVEEWDREFERVDAMMKSGEAAQLFGFDFASVPDTERLTDWLATKWAPAVLRTYDIAAIRTGARPVYALKSDERTIEVVWQELVDFETVTVGRMLIKVGDTSLTATRASGDASKGFATVSTKPLAGEDVLVRQLAEAASQAVEKGLATKVRAFVAVPFVHLHAAIHSNVLSKSLLKLRQSLLLLLHQPKHW